MAVAYDSVSATQSVNGATSVSWSHTNSGSTSLYLRICVPWTSFPGTVAISAITYDSVSLASNLVGNVNTSTFQATLRGDASIYELPNPATGTKTAAITWNTTNGAYGGGIGSVMYTGVKQTTPCSGTAVTNNGNTSSTQPTTTVTSTTSGNMVGDCMAMEPGGGTITITSGTQRLNSAGGGGQAGAGGDIAAGGSVTITWGVPNSNTKWITVAAEILVAGASSAIKTVDGLAKASVKTFEGLAIASVKTINGLA